MPRATEPSATRASRSRSPVRNDRSRSTSCRGSSTRPSGSASKRASASGCWRSSDSSPTCTARARSWPTASCRVSSSRARQHFHRCVAGIEPPGGVRIHVAGIDLVRDDAGTLPRPRGQPAHAVGDLVRRREPASDDPRVPRAVRQPSHPSGLRLPAAPARVAPEHGTRGCRRTVCGGAHTWSAQRGVLRAFVPRTPDGRRAGRGPRSRVPRPVRVHAHDRGGTARRRGVPPHRRRLPRSRSSSDPTPCSAVRGS